MRIGFLECFAGISGDMMLGALIDAGVPASVFHAAVAALNAEGLNARLHIEKVDRSGIQATKVHVLDGEEPAEAHEAAGHSHAHGHAQGHEQHGAHDHPHPHSHDHPHDHGKHPEHEHGLQHQHGHQHGRSWKQIHALISRAALEQAVKSLALAAFRHLAEAEGRIHGLPAEQVHFHEVGSVDAIVDITCAAAGLCTLGVDSWTASPINVGSGMVECAHGLYPVPAPATAELLRGMPTYSAGPAVEMVTPTGAALLRALAPGFTPRALTAESIGYGAGSRNPARFPNVLRLSVGPVTGLSPGGDPETVTVLACALDDASPQLIAHVMEQALASGALDVMAGAVVMKKGRLGTLLTVLATPETAPVMESLLLRETTTLGVRVRQERRVVLPRQFVTAHTEFGAIAMKVGGAREDGAENVMPEYEDCRRAALQNRVPLKQVQQAALSAYFAAREVRA